MTKLNAFPSPGKEKLTLSKELICEISELIVYISKNLEDEKNTNTDKLSNVIFGNDIYGYLILSIDESKKYHRLLVHLYLQLCRTNQISKDTVNNLVNITILKALDIKGKKRNVPIEDRISDAISEFSEELHAGAKCFMVYYPVCGLDSGGLPFSFGDIRFLIMNDVLLNDLGFRGNLNGQEQTDQQYIKIIHNGAHFNQPYACIEIETFDPTIARIMAIEKIRAHMEILNFYSDLIPFSSRQFIYLPGNAEQVTTISLIKEIKPTPSILSLISMDPAGPNYLPIPAIIEADDKHNYGFKKVLSLLGEKRTEYEERLLLALRWAGKATMSTFQGLKGDALLQYITALETLFSFAHSEVTYRLSLSIAKLLQFVHEKPEEIFDDFKQLYGSRSKIVHGGLVDQVNEFDLLKMRSITKKCILILLTKEPFCSMRNQDELETWINKQLLTNGN